MAANGLEGSCRSVLRHRYLTFLLSLFVVLILLPVIIVRGCNFYDQPRLAEPPHPGPTVSLRRAATGEIVELHLEEYVKGVVAAEMPVLFSSEALKAQAVLARTYVVTRLRAFGGPGDPADPNADISDDPAQGQAWLDEAALRGRWGNLRYGGYWRKISEACDATAGLIAVYDGDPIQAAYHSTCGGRTESAAAVWQSDLPYLQPVDCAYDGHSPRLTSSASFTWAELQDRLGPGTGALAVAAASGQGDVVQILGRTPGGRADSVRVGDMVTRGVSIRAALGLRSANFTTTETATGVTFTTRGFGHGVGMCQYGADGLAKQGHRYAEILAHYLPGVALRPLFAR